MQEGCRVPQRLLQCGQKGHLLFVLIKQDAQNVLALDIGGVAQHKGSPLLLEVEHQLRSSAQHGWSHRASAGQCPRRTGRASIFRTDSSIPQSCTARCRSPPKVVGQCAAADQCGCTEPHPAQQRADRPGRALRENGQPAAPAGKKLQHVPLELGQIACGIQQQAVQITETKVWSMVVSFIGYFPPVR